MYGDHNTLAAEWAHRLIQMICDAQKQNGVPDAIHAGAAIMVASILMNEILSCLQKSGHGTAETEHLFNACASCVAADDGPYFVISLKQRPINN